MNRWLGKHPAVLRYLDPLLVAVSGVQAATVDDLLGRLPVPHTDVVGLGGTAYPCLYQFGNAADAKAAACALRTHFAHDAAAVAAAAPGGHVAGPVAQIVQFKASALYWY